MLLVPAVILQILWAFWFLFILFVRLCREEKLCALQGHMPCALPLCTVCICLCCLQSWRGNIEQETSRNSLLQVDTTRTERAQSVGSLLDLRATCSTAWIFSVSSKLQHEREIEWDRWIDRWMMADKLAEMLIGESCWRRDRTKSRSLGGAEGHESQGFGWATGRDSFENSGSLIVT